MEHEKIVYQSEVMLYSSYVLCSTVILLYLYILAKACLKQNTQYMQVMLVLFIISQVLWLVAYQIFLNHFKAGGTGHLWLALAMFGLYNSVYSVVHWVFAFHYYSAAVCLDTRHVNFTRLKVLQWTLIVINFVLPLF